MFDGSIQLRDHESYMVEEAFRRARRPDQKRQRRVTILDATAQLIDQAGAEGVSLNQIARRMGLAKSNLYRYFESREQILGELFLEELKGWCGDSARRLAPLAGHNSPTAVAAALVASLVERPRLCELSRALIRWPAIVADDEVAAEPAQRTRAATAELEAALAAALPSIPKGREGAVPRAVLALAAGLAPSAERRPCAAAGSELESVVRALIYGLLVEGWRASGRRVTPG